MVTPSGGWPGCGRRISRTDVPDSGWSLRQDQAMPWDASSETEVVASYRLQFVLSRGDKADRQAADRDHWWAWEAIEAAISDATLPVGVLDALLHDPDADDEYRAYVAAGPIEELLGKHGSAYAEPIQARCGSDSVWAWTVGNVWLGREEWLSLPTLLRGLVPEPVAAEKPQNGGRRPSKRQGKRPRR